MEPQIVMEVQRSRVAQPQAAQIEASDDGLEGRVARLEATVAELQEALRKLLTPPERLAFRPFSKAEGRDSGYTWVEQPAHLKNISDTSQLEPEELVYIHELTDEDVRRRLEELEQWYGMSSEELYQRWQRGEADDVFDKTEWSILYEHWLQTKAEASRSDGGTE